MEVDLKLSDRLHGNSILQLSSYSGKEGES